MGVQVKLSYESRAINPFYVYRAVPVRVVDGDTVDLDVDLGFQVYRRERIRLAGIDAPEMRGPERPRGVEAREALIGMMWDGMKPRNVTLWTMRDRRGKFGRYIGVLFVTVNGESIDLNKWMVEKGYAEKWD